MKSLKKLLSGVLAVLFLILYFPNLTFAGQHHLYAQAGITKHKPEILSTPEEDIPTIEAKKTSSWTWLILLGLAGGIAAAAGGGGGGDSGGGASPPPPEEGNVTVTW
jgi:hypothetical protein